MQLRSGIIIPFQYQDSKKLIMIGDTEENRELELVDLKNVVRAAFQLCEFEFRNKKIDCKIPDCLLLPYLSQCHDLTNFVIEIREVFKSNNKRALTVCDETASKRSKANSNENIMKEKPCESVISFEPSFSTKIGPQQQKTVNSVSNGLANNIHSPLGSSPIHNSGHSNNQELSQKIYKGNMFSEHTPESMTQSLDPLDFMLKSESDDCEIDQVICTELQEEVCQPSSTPFLQQSGHNILQQKEQKKSNFFDNNGPSKLGNASLTSHCAASFMSGLRRRGERMSKNQKEIYVNYVEENPCILTQRRNDIALEPCWRDLTTLLNSVPQGAVKNVEEWKQTFDAWRYRVFLYTRYNSELIGAAAQDPKNYKPLTPTDQRAYAIWTNHKKTTSTEIENVVLDGAPNEYDF